MLKFLTVSEANTKYMSVYDNWQQVANGVRPAPLAPAEAFAELEKVRRWSMRSKTAQWILSQLDDPTTKQCNVICYAGTGQTVFAGDEPQPDIGTIHWDINARFASNNGTKDFHQYIAMLHEMGHYIQWSQNPSFYKGNMLHNFTGMKNSVQSFFRNKEKGRGGNFGAQRRHADSRMLNPQAPSGKAWNVRIEMDNLLKHEWPICDEARVPRRNGYTDLVMADGSLKAV